ncbi:MAG: hypothetical protein U9N14_07360, partial [Pseudomonadota bacterium]|nr:hypothetical protein [Pseudomonadota bacterium]
LDADRFDYLQRDGLNCGASYGTFAPDWLIHNIYIAEQGGHLYLSHKALAAAEEYVLARYHMYRAVYLHKTTRAAEAMLHALLARFRDLVRKYETLEGVRRIIPDCPKVMFDSFSKPMNLAEYLNLDDALLIAFFHNCADADDRVLADMGRGLLNRRLFKVIDASDHFDPGLAESRGFSDKACTILEKAGFDPRFYFFMDAPVDVPYKHYKPAADKHHQILIQDKAGAIRELSELSPAVRALAREYKLKRYFFPREVETDIRALWAKCIKG